MNKHSQDEFLKSLQEHDSARTASSKAELEALQAKVAALEAQSKEQQRQISLFLNASEKFFGLPSTLSPYNHCRGFERIGKLIQQSHDLDAQAEEMGYRSAARAIYALGKTRTNGCIPDEFQIVPEKFITAKVSPTKASAQWKKLQPVIHDLWNDPSLDETDLSDFNERIEEAENFDSFANFIYGVRRQELRGEFAQQAEATQSILEERLAKHQLPPAPSNVAGLLPAERQSHHIEFAETGVTTVEKSKASELTQQQLDACSEEQLEMIAMLDSL